MQLLDRVTLSNKQHAVDCNVKVPTFTVRSSTLLVYHSCHSCAFNCRRTPDGSAYPLDMPWGNSGTIMNGMCAAAMYQFIQVDQPTHPVYKGASCFLRQQLGYFFNHKCTQTGSCNTGASSEGFSYQVGCVLQLMACTCTLVLRDVCAVYIVPFVQLL